MSALKKSKSGKSTPKVEKGKKSDKKKISLRIYRTERDVMVAACDSELLEKVFTEGEFCLQVSREFYGDKTVGESELLNALAACTVANLVGEATVSSALKAGFVSSDCVLRIAGIPHAQFMIF